MANTIKATFPELVDLKITDFCTANCAFCYQSSSPGGQHAPLNLLKAIINMLAKAEVFEVALGGGEPTEHPEFLDILFFARKNNVVPNFSTKNFSWLKRDNIRPFVWKAVGAVAFSVSSVDEVKELNDLVSFYEETDKILLNKYYDYGSRVHLQIIPELLSSDMLRRILTAAKNFGMPTTLLGLKLKGRAAQSVLVTNPQWEEVIISMAKDFALGPVGADTTIMKSSSLDINLGIPNYMYYVTEGSFSMYIDAVTKIAGPSSFCDTDKTVVLDINKIYNTPVKYLKELFAKIDVE